MACGAVRCAGVGVWGDEVPLASLPSPQVPMQASTVALGVAAIDARLARVAASGDGGYRRRGAEGRCTACTRCALSSWQLLSTRSAMCARGAVCAELPLASQPSMRVHRSSERVFLPMPRPSPYDAHVLYARAGDEVPLAPLRWRRTTPRRPLDAVGRREDMRCRAMRQCWRLE